nr:tRNA pseudouridine(55) synthase TruB [Allorhizocola rhizosphaerae]
MLVSSPDGLLVVDKPAGMTSHDVVARARRTLGTRKVGHAGTLDPMATGVLILGVGRATRLLTYVVGTDKVYRATIRLGQSTITDDAEGEVTFEKAAGDVTGIESALAGMTGEMDQVPSAVSAIKIKGVRSYHRVRQGEQVELPARRVHIRRIDVLAIRRETDVTDVDVEVECSSGTYIRAIARDLGAALDVGGHLTALRRTRVGNFTIDEASDDLIPVSAALERLMPLRHIDADQARVVAHGGPLPPVGQPGPYGVVGPDGAVLAVFSERDGRARPEIVLVGGS